MDLQLYRVDSQNYLVDFRNIGYFKISTGESLSEDDPAVQSSVPLSEEDAGKVRKEGSGGSGSGNGNGSKIESIGGVSGPFHFLEMACQLIAELAN
jgi:carbon catabolite-derepressing protein kinase